jgi:hypothetical protein
MPVWLYAQYPAVTLVKNEKSLPNGLIGVSGTDGPKNTSSAVSFAPIFHGSDVLRRILGRALCIVSRAARIYNKKTSSDSSVRVFAINLLIVSVFKCPINARTSQGMRTCLLFGHHNLHSFDQHQM